MMQNDVTVNVMGILFLRLFFFLFFEGSILKMATGTVLSRPTPENSTTCVNNAG